MSDSEALQQTQTRPHLGRVFVQLVSDGFPALFIIFQVFRLASLVMFSIFVIDCTLYYDATSVDCGNFTLYSMPVCDAYCWKAIWLICSILTATICICLMRKSSFPDLRPFGYTAIWKRLIRKPYFWSLNSITSLVIIYDILIMYQNRGAKIYIECLVAASKIWTLHLIYQLNFTYPPCRAKDFRRITRAAYCITLSIFALDNLCKLLVVSAQVAFKFYTVNPTAAKPLTIVDLVLMVINGSLYHSFFQFFWQKLFRGDKDILKEVKHKFHETSRILENTEGVETD